MERLSRLREELRREHLSAFIFPTTDPHGNECAIDYWKGCEWISGFKGKNGVAVVTLKSAALWTDLRGLSDAKELLGETEFQLMGCQEGCLLAVAEWLGREVADMDDKEVGIDGMVSPVLVVENLKEALRRRGGITVRTNFDPLKRIWQDRPAVSCHPVVQIPVSENVEETKSKLARVRHALRERHADGMLVTSLDDIAWTLNLKGSDGPSTLGPVSYLLVASNQVTLFIHQGQLPSVVTAYLHEQGVETAGYADVFKGLRDYFEYNILLDPEEVCYTLYQQVTRKVIRETSPFHLWNKIKKRPKNLLNS